MAKPANMIRLVLCVAIGLPLVDACSVNAGKAVAGMGEMMMDAGGATGGGQGDSDGSILMDAGEILRDAGDAIAGDGGSSDASAQAGTKVPWKSGSRIEMRVTTQQGTDGSVYPGYPQPYDTQRDEPCNLTRAEDGKMRCLPGGVASIAQFADDKCTQAVALLVSPGCATQLPKYVSENIPASGCTPARTKIYMRGNLHAGTVYALGGAGGTTCVAATRVATWEYYLRDAAVSASSFVEFSEGPTTVL